MRYRYVKAEVSLSQASAGLFPSWPGRFLPVFLFFSGLSLLLFASAPIFYYQLFYSPSFDKLAKPVSDDFLTGQDAGVLGEKTNLKMTDASSWFPTAPRLPQRPSKITHYTLSIPKLGIKEALVTVGGEDLKKSLIHYEGTAFPGQFGNTVIFGHSTLPQFFNPQNYVSIFSTLPTLKKGEEVLLDFDGVKYRYLIEAMFEVAPADISVLEQRFDDSYLTLVTCVPPGTYLRRLIVRARLTSP